MRLDVVIPTRDRLEKLRVCLESVKREMVDGTRVYVYFDTPDDIRGFLSVPMPRIPDMELRTVPGEYRAPDLWNYHLRHMAADAMMYLSDDVELLGDSVRVAVNEFLFHFHQYNDGVVGMRQANLEGVVKTAPAAFGIVGAGFAQRFPNSQVFCPDYYHLWIDMELEWYAKSVNKFVFAEDACLNHYHPCIDPGLEDETHRRLRERKDLDREMWKERRKRGYLWGKDFRLVGRR